MSTSTLPHTTLYFRDGASDKVYQAQVIERGEGYIVQFQYGRRGSALKSGCKTAQPVSLETAQKVYDKLIASKTSKGYTQAESGQAYQGTDNAGRVSGVLPQLLNPIQAAEAFALANDNDWFSQIKYDGERRLIRVANGQAEGINRKGLTVALAEHVAETAIALAAADGETVFDGEDMGGYCVLFDVLVVDGQDLRAKPAKTRFERLEALFHQLHSSDDLPPFPDALVQAATAFASAEKRAMLVEAEARGEEGCVFKHTGAAYSVGRPASGGNALKRKFVEEATVRVAGINDGKRSVQIEVMDTDGTWQSVGNVTIPPSVPVPHTGLIEVQYLYAFRGGSLFQPTFKRLRPDLDESAASIVQLKFKQEARAAA